MFHALKEESDLPIIKISEKLHLVPSELSVSALELELTNRINRERQLSLLIEKVEAQYDYIFIDCPPSLGLLTINALTASNEIYIPLDAQYFSMKGLDKLLSITAIINKALNK